MRAPAAAVLVAAGAAGILPACMRVALFPSGTRGDFQPLLAFAVGLKAAGHAPHMVCNPNFCRDAEAFGIACTPIGVDNEALLRGLKLGISHTRAAYQIFHLGRGRIAGLVDQAIPLAQGADAIIGSGTQRSAATVAELLGVPYVHVAYSPQTFRSSRHAPFVVPLSGLPAVVNRLLWDGFLAASRAAFIGPLDDKRRALGLAPVRDTYEYLYPRGSFLAADPEIAPLPPDSTLIYPPLGAFLLPDRRPLGAELERFLAAGPPPVYIGFGSNVDPDPEGTTALLVAAAAAAGVRLVLSSGWAGYGERMAASDAVLAVGSVSHALLLPRVAAIVHHGGAGTTAAAARSGRPQIVVPHVFDQFQWARWVHRAGLGPAPIARSRLTVERLAAAVRAAHAPDIQARAAALAERLRDRDPVADAVALLARIVGERAAPPAGRAQPGRGS